jgi:polysaccharide pyruvyl transferase WcaK-like protein
VLRRLFVIGPAEIVFLVKSCWLLGGVDLVIVGGSGQLIDVEGGPWNHPYNHFKWACLAKLVGAKFAFLSVGAGPIRTSLGKWFIRTSLLLASYRSFRDVHSKRLIESIGIKRKNLVYPDQAFGIVPPPETGTAGSYPAIGVAPIAYCDPRHWYEPNAVVYEDYVKRISSFVLWLAKTNHKVLLFHTQLNGDDRVISDLKEILKKDADFDFDGSITECPVKWYQDAFSAISQTKIVVASRFHAILFSYLLNRPVLGLSYHQKIDDMMTAFGQQEYRLDINDFTVDRLKEKFTQLETDLDSARRHIQRKVLNYKALIDEQYDKVLR